MKKALLPILFIFTTQLLFAQEIENTEIYKEFRLLGYIRSKYKDYNKMAENAPSSMNLKRKKDSLYNLYTSKIKEIKKSPTKYLRHINWAIANNKLNGERRSMAYDYFPSISSHDPRHSMVTQLDMYKIIRYSLFERRDDVLPDLVDVPFYDKKKLIPYVQSYEDMKVGE